MDIFDPWKKVSFQAEKQTFRPRKLFSLPENQLLPEDPVPQGPTIRHWADRACARARASFRDPPVGHARLLQLDANLDGKDLVPKSRLSLHLGLLLDRKVV